ncbi:MAG: type VII secretion protein EccB [Propionibacteriaceae bacterium]|nr:type VII secretion protein EccB [Propionibacteriaceae bacterium]
MASNRDILDAQRFNRSRLVTAFTSGMPGGRELEPRSPLTPLIIGIVLTVVLIATALVMRRFAPTMPDGWQNNYVLIINGTGARYYTENGVMHPITNITSAKLLTQAGSFHVAEVPASVTEGIPRGPQVGLSDAPDDVPAPSALITGAWTACAVSDSATQTWIGDAPDSIVDAPMLLVSNAKKEYLVAGGLRYPMDTKPTAVVAALGLVDLDVHPVRADWLNLLAPASPLRPLIIAGAGRPATGMPATLAAAVVGSRVDVNLDGKTTHYVVNSDSHLIELSDVAYRLYMIGTGANAPLVGGPINATMADVAPLVAHNIGTVPLEWPTTVDNSNRENAVPCLQRPMTGNARVSVLGTAQADDATGTSDGHANIQGGAGALIHVPNGTLFGSVRLIDDSGFAYGIGGDITDTLARLGYAPTDVTTVPSTWAALIPPKNSRAPVLSPASAGATS